MQLGGRARVRIWPDPSRGRVGVPEAPGFLVWWHCLQCEGYCLSGPLSKKNSGVSFLDCAIAVVALGGCAQSIGQLFEALVIGTAQNPSMRDLFNALVGMGFFGFLAMIVILIAGLLRYSERWGARPRPLCELSGRRNDARSLVLRGGGGATFTPRSEGVGGRCAVGDCALGASAHCAATASCTSAVGPATSEPVAAPPPPTPAEAAVAVVPLAVVLRDAMGGAPPAARPLVLDSVRQRAAGPRIEFG